MIFSIKTNKGFLMLVDTHCHVNMMVKKDFDRLLDTQEIETAQTIIHNAQEVGVKKIINVGTSLMESENCLILAKKYDAVWATVGLHPNDCTHEWAKEFEKIKEWVKSKKEHKIVGIGECGFDFHYPEYHIQRQTDAFRAQIELALENDLALVVHSRDARDETLKMLEEYKNHLNRCVIHCFSEDQDFAEQVTSWGFYIGLGGTITYPKNQYLRDIATRTNLKKIVLETDAPFLPPQVIRGKQNSPQYIAVIAHFLAEIRCQPFEIIAEQTTLNANDLFQL